MLNTLTDDLTQPGAFWYDENPCINLDYYHTMIEVSVVWRLAGSEVVDPAELVSKPVYDATLAEVNDMRRVAHLPELLRMPNGRGRTSQECPLQRALNECGVLLVQYTSLHFADNRVMNNSRTFQQFISEFDKSAY